MVINELRLSPAHDTLGRALTRSDPYQMRDLAEEKSAAATLRHYRDKSQAWRKERNDTFEACTWYRDHWTRDRNIILTANGVQQDLAALEQIRAKWLKA